MKAKIYFLLAALPLLVWGCSDDESFTEQRARELSKVYRGDGLSLEVNGEQTSDKTVELHTTDLQNAEVSFNYLIPGENPLTTTAALTPTSQTGSYTFSGESINADREIRYTGSVGDKLAAQMTYRSLSPAVGKWGTVKVSGKHVQLDIIPSHEGATIDMKGFRGNYVVPLVSTGNEKSLQSEITGLGNLLFLIVMSLDVDLQENGDLTASWTINLPTKSEGSSQPGMVRFNVNEGRLYAAVAIDKMLFGGDSEELNLDIFENISTADIPVIYDLLQKVYMGLPLVLDFPVDGKIEVRLTREMMMPYLDVIFPLLTGLVADLDLGAIGTALGLSGEILAEFLPELQNAIVTSQKFDLVITLNKK